MSQSNGQEIAVHLFEVQTEIALKHGIDLPGRSIQLVGEIDEEMFMLIDAALTILEHQSKAKITIKINSPGGSIYDALAIVGRMQKSNCKIITEGYGCIMSAAGLILAAGNKRSMSKYAWYMFHEASWGADGTHTQIKHVAAQIEREEEMWSKAMESFTSASAEFWSREGKSGKDLYLDAGQCMELSIIDEVF